MQSILAHVQFIFNISYTHQQDGVCIIHVTIIINNLKYKIYKIYIRSKKKNHPWGLPDRPPGIINNLHPHQQTLV